mgnify:CR=1 FL=1
MCSDEKICSDCLDCNEYDSRFKKDEKKVEDPCNVCGDDRSRHRKKIESYYLSYWPQSYAPWKNSYWTWR